MTYPTDYETAQSAATGPEVLCGNRLHPDGPWHPATPLPMSWRWRERRRQARNRRQWGCTCHRAQA